MLHHRTSFLIVALLTSVLVAGAVSCTSTAEASVPGTAKDMDPFTLSLDIEPGFLRMDIIRETWLDGTEGGTRPADYSPLVIRLGNGLVMDTNLNLGIDICEVLNTEGTPGFRTESVTTSIFGEVRETFERTPDSLVRNAPSGMVRKTTAWTRNGTVWTGSDSPARLTLTPDSATLSTGPLSGSITVTRTANLVLVPGLMGPASLTLAGPDSVSLGTGVRILSQDNRITILIQTFMSSRTISLARGENAITIVASGKTTTLTWKDGTAWLKGPGVNREYRYGSLTSLKEELAPAPDMPLSDSPGPVVTP